MDRIQPRQLTRDQLATFLKSPELIRAFERYIDAISTGVPDALSQTQAIAVMAQDGASSARGAARRAESAAMESLVLQSQETARAVRSMADRLERAAAEQQALLLTLRTQASTIHQLQRQVEDLRALTLGG